VKRRSGHLPFAISDRPRYFWHIDAYRLSAEKDLLSINFPEILKDRESIVAIEWADRVRSAIPKEAIWFSFRHHKEGRLVMVRKRTPRRTSPQGGSRGNATR
jgi:tRNA A37 threonylcarbamoyladenosine biosynthesis protein TsaE